MKTLSTALLFTLFGAVAPAALGGTITMLEPIRSSDVKAWNDKAAGDVECRELSDIPNAFLCLTRTDDLLTGLMARTSYFKEATPRGQVVAADDPKFMNSDQAHYVGHDTMAMAVGAFYDAIALACATDRTFCTSPLETEMLEKLVRPLQQRKADNFAILAVTAGTEGFMSNATHEILHARYYLDAGYRAAVTRFWNNQVAAEDRDKIRAFLATTYNFEGAEGQELLVNEFQAYTLEDDADTDASGFARIEKTYGDPLRAVLGVLPAASRQ